MTEPLFALHQVSCHFQRNNEDLAAVDGVSLSIRAGEVLGLVGESGSGKSTLGRIIAGLQRPSHGTLRFNGAVLPEKLQRRRAGQIQMVFQDSYASLNPRMTIGDSLSEPLLARGERRSVIHQRQGYWLERVGLGARFAQRYPHELSGGQRQRVGIARAFLCEPQLVVCDEAVSALDVSVQAQILALLREIQSDLGTAMVFITHDLAVLGGLADRIAVMYLGELLELAPCWQLLNTPAHPYTQQLLAAHPEPTLDRNKVQVIAPRTTELPLPLSTDVGCRFADRCPYALEACRQTPPWLKAQAEGRAVACHRSDDIAGVAPAG